MLTIRPAVPEDAALIRQLIRELAEYEKEPDADAAILTEEDILRDGFGEWPYFHVVIAEWSGSPAGYALYFFEGIWLGRAGPYLKDLFVRPALRRRGIGKALLQHVADRLREKGLDTVHVRFVG